MSLDNNVPLTTRSSGIKYLLTQMYDSDPGGDEDNIYTCLVLEEVNIFI